MPSERNWGTWHPLVPALPAADRRRRRRTVTLACPHLTRPLRRGFEERADLLRIFGCRRIVNHQGEIGPAIDREPRKLQRQLARDRMVQDFAAVAVALHVIVAPHCRE